MIYTTINKFITRKESGGRGNLVFQHSTSLGAIGSSEFSVENEINLGLTQASTQFRPIRQ